MEQVIVDMAHRLGLEAARVWPQVVMVTWLKGLFYSVSEPVIVLLCAWGIAALLRICARSRAQRNKDDLDDIDSGMTIVLCGMTICVLAVVGFVALSDVPNQLAAAFYPEAVTVINLAKAARF